MGFLVLTHLSLNLVMVTHMMCIVNTLDGPDPRLYGVEGVDKDCKISYSNAGKEGLLAHLARAPH